MSDANPPDALAGAPWDGAIEALLRTSHALALGRFTLAGDVLFLNAGMRAMLGGENPDRPRHAYLTHPPFERLRGDADGLVFEGLLTVGDGYHAVQTLRAQVWRRADQLLIWAEHDVLELDRLQQSLSATNQEINNLQRELIRKNVRLTQTLTAAEQQLQTLRDSEQRLRQIVAHIADPVLVTDTDARIHAVNPAFTQTTGYAASEVLDRTPRLLASGHHPPSYYRTMWRALHDDGHWRGIIWNRRKDGSLYVQRLSISALRDSHDTGLYVGVYNNIEEELRALEQARFQAEHDALTGLPNRFLLLDRLTAALADARHRGTLVAVLFIDLNQFKPINDRFGHAVGDTVLQLIARRIERALRATDTVARLGGDEFVAVLRDLDAASTAAATIARLQHDIERPLRVAGQRLRVVASIGSAIGPRPDEDASALIARADTAMYVVKRAGQAHT